MTEHDAEHERHLATTTNAVLATIRGDGSIQMSPNWYLWTGASVLISTSDWTAKVHNIRRDPRATVCIDDPDTGRYVVITGAAAVIDGVPVRDLTLDLIRKYEEEPAVVPHWERINRNGDRVIIEVQAEHVFWRRGF